MMSVPILLQCGCRQQLPGPGGNLHHDRIESSVRTRAANLLALLCLNHM
jgi:hypothetical protein